MKFKLLVFTSEFGQDLNKRYLTKNQEDEDKAAYEYLRDINNFAFDEDTQFLQYDVKNKNIVGMYARLKNLVNNGYACFALEECGIIEEIIEYKG